MTVGVAEPLYHLNDPPMRTAKPARPNQPFPIRPEGRRSGAMWILGGPSASRADRRPAADFDGFWQRHAIMRGGQHHQTAADLHRSWWPGPGSNRRPSAFRSRILDTPQWLPIILCHNMVKHLILPVGSRRFSARRGYKRRISVNSVRGPGAGPPAGSRGSVLAALAGKGAHAKGRGRRIAASARHVPSHR